MTTLTPVKTSEAAKMLVLRRVAKHHEHMAYMAKLEAENIELRRGLAGSEYASEKSLTSRRVPFGETDPSIRSEPSSARGYATACTKRRAE